jgi:hypothetical protein
MNLPDIEEIEDCIDDGDGKTDYGIKCDLTNEYIRGVRYFAMFKRKEGARSETMNFSADAILSGSYPVRSFTPTIYYRLRGTLGKK